MGLGRNKSRSFGVTKRTVTMPDGSKVDIATNGIGASASAPTAVTPSPSSGSGNTKLVDVRDDVANVGFIYAGPVIVSRVFTGNFVERGGIAVVQFKGKLWMIGGYDINWATLNEVWSSIDGITWQKETIVGLPAITNHSATVYNGEIWLTGGTSPDNFTSNKNIYHSADGTNWSAINNPPFNGGTTTRIAAISTQMMVVDEDVNKLRAWVSVDGITWTLKNPSIITASVPDLQHPSDFAFYGIGTTFYIAGGQHAAVGIDHDVIFKTLDVDGVSWEGIGGIGFNGDWVRYVRTNTATYIIGGRHGGVTFYSWVFDANGSTDFMGAIIHKRDFDLGFINNKIFQIAGQDSENGNNPCNKIVEIQFKQLYTK